MTAGCAGGVEIVVNSGSSQPACFELFELDKPFPFVIWSLNRCDSAKGSDGKNSPCKILHQYPLGLLPTDSRIGATPLHVKPISRFGLCSDGRTQLANGVKNDFELRIVFLFQIV